ncbi:MAG: hypothetical protein RBR20_11210 [Desulfobacterales bacterium]|jgi:hypothetical protein|nr:hypothetical protein [Desulfobacterales bacterium]
MRTTLSIDDDLLAAAKALAQARSVSVGTIVSALMRKGLQSKLDMERKSGLPVFKVGLDARPITLEDVKKLEDLA